MYHYILTYVKKLQNRSAKLFNRPTFYLKKYPNLINELTNNLNNGQFDHRGI